MCGACGGALQLVVALATHVPQLTENPSKLRNLSIQDVLIHHLAICAVHAMTDIVKWMNEIPSCGYDSTSGDTNRPRQHKRPYPLTPESEGSHMADPSTPTKRRRPNDDDKTPRAAILNPLARSISSSPSKSSASFRSSSQASSSRRKLSSLDIAEEGIIRRQLSLQSPGLPTTIRGALLRFVSLKGAKVYCRQRPVRQSSILSESCSTLI